MRTDNEALEFVDRVQGRMSQSLESEIGDFVVLRADGLFSYQLAVVVDDAEQGVTDVVRGADLLDSTARQIYLQRLLGLPTPRYLHVPVAANAAGEKLSKQTFAADARPSDLPLALRFLGMAAQGDLEGRDLLRWASEHWDSSRIPRARSIGAGT